MRDKVMAFASEAKTSAGIIGSLPFGVAGVLALVAPDYISLLFTTTIGNWLLAAGAAFMTVGIVVMRSMINFEV